MSLNAWSRGHLSSIRHPRRRIGYDAAALLENLMAGEPRPQSDITLQPPRRAFGVPPKRKPPKTRLFAPRSGTSEHYREPIRVDDVADAAVVPAARWNAASGTPWITVLDEITRRRIETARRLLVETDLDIGGVAKRSGFSDARRMAVVSASVWDAPRAISARKHVPLMVANEEEVLSDELGSSRIAYPSLGSEASSDNSFGNRSSLDSVICFRRDLLSGVRRDLAQTAAKRRQRCLATRQWGTTSNGIDQILVLLAVGHPNVAAFVDHLAISINILVPPLMALMEATPSEP